MTSLKLCPSKIAVSLACVYVFMLVCVCMSLSSHLIYLLIWLRQYFNNPGWMSNILLVMRLSRRFKMYELIITERQSEEYRCDVKVIYKFNKIKREHYTITKQGDII